MAVVGRKADQYPLRMPEGMRDRLSKRAEVNRRSLNSEIIHVLDRALAAENEKGPAATAIAPDLNTTHP